MALLQLLLGNPYAAQAHAPGSACAATPEPAFRLTGTRLLQISDPDGLTVTYLARLISRQPGDLTSHVRRLSLALGRGDGPESFSALVDLFIAFGTGREALRRRMLEIARTVLSPEQTEFLAARVGRGLRAEDHLPLPAPHSVLTHGLRPGGVAPVQVLAADW